MLVVSFFQNGNKDGDELAGLILNVGKAFFTEEFFSLNVFEPVKRFVGLPQAITYLGFKFRM